MLLFTLKSQIKQICGKNSKRLQELIKFSRCANQHMDEITKCYYRYIDALMGIKDVPDHKDKIPLVCW